MNDKLKKIKSKGFTLVELVVVVVIIAILIGVTIKGIYGYVTSSKRNTDVANAAAMQDALSSLALDDGVCEYLENENVALGTTWTATWRKPSNVDWGEFPEKIKDKILEMVNNELPEAKKKKNFTLTATNTARGLDVTVSAGTTATDSIIIDVASNDTGDKENTGGVGGTGGNTGTGSGNTGTGGSNTGTGSGTGGSNTGSGTGGSNTGSGSNTSGGAQNGVGNTETGVVTCKDGTANHHYDDITVTKKATCVDYGERTIKCTVCKHSYTDIIPVKDHNWDDNMWCTACNKCYLETLTWKELETGLAKHDPSVLSNIRNGHTKKCGKYTYKLIKIEYSGKARLYLAQQERYRAEDNIQTFTWTTGSNIAKSFYRDFNDSSGTTGIATSSRLPGDTSEIDISVDSGIWYLLYGDHKAIDTLGTYRNCSSTDSGGIRPIVILDANKY